jgi:hypothetical protein
VASPDICRWQVRAFSAPQLSRGQHMATGKRRQAQCP